MPDSYIEIPDCRQPNHWACGACAAFSVGRYYGVGPLSLEAWIKALHTDVEQSTHPQAIIGYLSSLGLPVEASGGMTLDNLRTYWELGWPVICPVQDYGPWIPPAARFDYGHYLTVIGIDHGYVVCQDSSEDNVIADSGSSQAPGRVIVDERDFVACWHDKDIDGVPYVRFGIAVGPPPGWQGPGSVDNSGITYGDVPRKAFKGRWVTLEGGQHVFIEDDGTVSPTGPRDGSSGSLENEPSSSARDNSPEANRARAELTDELMGDLAKATGLEPGVEKQFRDAIKTVMDNMPAGAIKRLMAGAMSHGFFNNADELGESLAEHPFVRQLLEDGYPPTGLYIPKERSLHYCPAGSHGVMGTMTHEMTHAIDGSQFALSRSPQWQDAFNSELSKGQLSRYGGTVSYEGFAEFGRALYSGAIQPSELEAKFPKCTRFFKEQNLW